MANDIGQLIPKVFARAMPVFRKRAVMPMLVNSDFGREVKKKGNTIDVPIPAAVGTIDVAPSHVPPQSQDTTPTTVPIALDKWRQSKPFFLTDAEMTQIEARDNFIPMQVEEAMKDLAEYVNSQIMALYKSFYSFHGSPASVPFNATDKVTSITQIDKLLNQQKCPKNDRRMVLHWDAQANALALPEFGDVHRAGSDVTKLDGEIGRKYGFDFYGDDDIPTHTTGAATGTAILVNNGAGYAVGATSMALDGLTAAPVPGDIFTTPGNNQHVVKTATTLSSDDSTITFYPPLKEALADDDELTFLASHKANLAFNRNAIGFVTRPLDLNTELNANSGFMTMFDPLTGIPLRMEVKRQHKQTSWEIDLLFGCAVIRPEYGARLIGLPG